eukprot:1159697-Pelagomonas_calceolata.AAC.10
MCEWDEEEEEGKEEGPGGGRNRIVDLLKRAAYAELSAAHSRHDRKSRENPTCDGRFNCSVRARGAAHVPFTIDGGSILKMKERKKLGKLKKETTAAVNTLLTCSLVDVQGIAHVNLVHCRGRGARMQHPEDKPTGSAHKVGMKAL